MTDLQMATYQSIANLIVQHLPAANFGTFRVKVVSHLVRYVAEKYPDADVSQASQHLPIRPHTAMSELADVWLQYDTYEKITAVTLLVINSVAHASVDE